jgi:predicted heme/steroid binding protein
VPSVQLAASANLGAGYILLDNTGAYQGQFGLNLYTGDGVPQSLSIQSQGKPMLFQNGPSYTNVAGAMYNVAGSYFWGFGGLFQAASTVGVRGNLAIGSTVSAGTAAPVNGLLVEGLSKLSGGMTGPITPAVIAVPAATNVNPTTANSGSTYTFAAGGTIWLPAATAATIGTVFTGVEIGTSSFQISDQNAGDVINYLGGQKAANSPYLATAQRGSSITVQCTAVNTWTVTSQLGSWS